MGALRRWVPMPLLAQEDVIGCCECEAEGRNVRLEFWSGDVGFDKPVQRVQCGMVSDVK